MKEKVCEMRNIQSGTPPPLPEPPITPSPPPIYFPCLTTIPFLLNGPRSLNVVTRFRSFLSPLKGSGLDAVVARTSVVQHNWGFRNGTNTPPTPTPSKLSLLPYLGFHSLFPPFISSLISLSFFPVFSVVKSVRPNRGRK